MPKVIVMAQLSRPFQIALLAVAVLAGVVLFALQGRSTSTSGSGSSPVVSATVPATAAHAGTAKSRGSSSSKSPGTPTHVGHGSGSSLGGLSRAIDRAQHAAAISQQHEAQVAEKSAQASNEAASSQTSSAPSASVTAAAPATHATTAKPVVKTSRKVAVSPAHSSAGARGAKSDAAALSGQRAVEAELAKGDVVVLLFWNPAGADDVAVHNALQQLSSAHNQKVAVQYALASQVASFGSVTRGVQVFATPTILVINKHGQTTVLTGVQDAFAVEQAIAEARSS
jgi:hypothetical protein